MYHKEFVFGGNAQKASRNACFLHEAEIVYWENVTKLLR